MLPVLVAAAFAQQPPWIEFKGKAGPGKGKHIVFLAGDEEYRSEEGLPQLARILAVRHGFYCTVLFSINERGEIDPDVRNNEPGLQALDSADLCVMLLRFRQWPDAQMAHFVNYYLSGKPIIALRTSTHAFDYPASSVSNYRRFGWNSQEWAGGFGQQVLGETWVSHWGEHGTQGTRGVLENKEAGNPILRGVGDVFCTTDVYEASPPTDSEILIRGQVVAGLNAIDPPANGLKKTALGKAQDINAPMMPVLWLRRPVNSSGRKNRIVTCTMGAATDLLNESLRRVLVNSAYWAIGLEQKVPKKTNVDLIGAYQPSPFGFGRFRKGVKPSDLQSSDPNVPESHGIAMVLQEERGFRRIAL